MKTMFRHLFFGLLGSSLIASSNPPLAMALSEDEILEKLAIVPVFILLEESGSWTRNVVDLPNDGLGYVAAMRVFFNEADLISFVETVRLENPTFHQGGTFGIIDLATIMRRGSENQEIPLSPIFVPSTEAFEAARALESNFRGVPLFALQDAPGSYLPLSSNGEGDETVFSMFFSKQDAEIVLDDINRENPDNPVVAQTQVGVISFADFLDNLRNSNDQKFQFVRFAPDSEVVNQIQNLQRALQNQQAP
ncbi:MAG: Tic22 family protein [Cyanobacteria bacterium P01_D01_bin.156]